MQILQHSRRPLALQSLNIHALLLDCPSWWTQRVTGLSKALNILSDKPKSANYNLYSTVNWQMFCNNIFFEDKNMTHFTFQSEQQKLYILDSFSKHTYLVFMFSVLLLFCFCSYLETEIRSLLSAHPDFDTSPYHNFSVFFQVAEVGIPVSLPCAEIFLSKKKKRTRRM